MRCFLRLLVSFLTILQVTQHMSQQHREAHHPIPNSCFTMGSSTQRWTSTKPFQITHFSAERFWPIRAGVLGAFSGLPALGPLAAPEPSAVAFAAPEL